MKKVLVTGATGFVGRGFCRSLRERDIPFDSLQRHKPGVSSPELGEVAYSVDLCGTDFPTECLQGVTTVVHLAGLAHTRASAELHEAVNNRATLRLASAAAEQGVDHFIFLSSVKAMGPGEPGLRRQEADVDTPNTAYGQSKRSAELGLKAVARQSGMRITVLRPALVYGPGVGGNLKTLLGYSSRFQPGLPDRGRRSMVALDDLVSAIHCVDATTGEGFECFIVAGEIDYTARSIQNAVRSSQGKGAARISLPIWCWRTASVLRDVLTSGSRSDESSFDKMFGDEMFSSDRLQAATPWRPVCSIEQQMYRMLDMATSGGVGLD